ncbi:MAG TPA: AI-2E family transporter [Thermoanaerobaculia bacterium]|nr:AI-2E family transporter [Thermoanaerobaculia bacterium]
MDGLRMAVFSDGKARDPEARGRLDVSVSWGTIFKLLAAALLVWAVLRLAGPFLLFLISLLLAVTLNPLAARLEKRGLSHGVAVGLLAAAMVAAIALFAWLVIPPLTDQVLLLQNDLATRRAAIQKRLTGIHPLVATIVMQILELPRSPEVAASLKRPLAWGRVAVVTGTATILVLVLTLYLVLDGRRFYAWLLAYVPRRFRRRMAVTVSEVSEVVIAYVQGQLFTSIVYGLYAFAALTIFRVPAAVPLAILAAFCDVIPVLGVVVSTVPAVLLALTVSPIAAAAVLALYILYHVIENYVLIPRVYGKRLRLSGLAVLIALVVGGTLQGILGAVLILPLVAAYPIVERIWLHEYLSDEVLTDHSALQEAAENGSDAAVDRVLRGQELPDPEAR